MNDKNMEILSNNLKKLMKEYGVNRSKMCNDLNLSYTTLTNWIKGTAYPRMKKVDLISSYFNVPKSSLVEENKDNPTLDNLYNTINNLNNNQQKEILSVANRIKKETLSKDKKESLNTDSKILNMLSDLNNNQKNQVLGFGMSLLNTK